jgi:hypothetical protein
MANLQKVYTPKYVIQNPAEVFINVQPPVSAIPPTAGTNLWAATGTYTIDANGQPMDNGAAGVYAGGTEGPLMAGPALKFDAITYDAHAAKVDAAFVSAAVDLEFTANEMLLGNLAKYLGAAGTFTSVAGGTNPAANFLQIGSPQSSLVTFFNILFTSPDHGNAGKYYVAQFYRCALAGPIALVWDRKKPTQMKVKLRARLDLTRVQGDMVGQIVKTF